MVADVGISDLFPTRFRPISSHLAIAPPVSVVIPAMNEAENLPYVFKPACRRGSTRWSWSTATPPTTPSRSPGELWPDVKVVEQRGKGKGDALISGFAAATGDIIVMVDADGSADGDEIVSYVSALVSGADFAKGSRFANGGGTDDMTPIRKLGNRVLCAPRQRQVRRPLHRSLLRLQRLLARTASTSIALDCTGFEVETLMNIRVVKAGLRVQEIPSHEYTCASTAPATCGRCATGCGC